MWQEKPVRNAHALGKRRVLARHILRGLAPLEASRRRRLDRLLLLRRLGHRGVLLRRRVLCVQWNEGSHEAQGRVEAAGKSSTAPAEGVCSAFATFDDPLTSSAIIGLATIGRAAAMTGRTA